MLGSSSQAYRDCPARNAIRIRHSSGWIMALSWVFAVATMCLGITSQARPMPLQVYILAGQSNMQGHADISTFPSMADDPRTAPILKEMLSADGTPRVCDRVWISSIGCAGTRGSEHIEQTGRLTAGFGASPSKIGPEYTFGLTMAKAARQPILIIKTSWGGLSLHTDFRPPSAGPEMINEYTRSQWRQRGLNVDEETAKVLRNGGVYYRTMIEHVRKVLADPGRVVPGYDPKQGYRLAGFVWFQGWNDMVDSWTYADRMKPGGYDEYSRLLAQFIRDVRKDLSAPDLPFVIGVMGVGGLKAGQTPPQSHFRYAQASPASLPEFQGTVAAVETAPFWADELEELHERRRTLNARLENEFTKEPGLTPEAKQAARDRAIAAMFTEAELERMKGISNGDYHYLGAARIIAPIGKAFAEAMLRLQRSRKTR